MFIQISIAAAGFSVVALVLLLLQKRAESNSAKVLAAALLCVLAGLQLLQVLHVLGNIQVTFLFAFLYLLCLGLVGPLFYLYSQHVIQSEKILRIQDGAHFLPVLIIALIGALYSGLFKAAFILMFLLGGSYMGRLVWSLYRLRARRSLFRMEFIFTASFISWALIVVLAGLLSSQAIELLIPIQIIMLALAIAAALHIQLNYPHLLSSLEEFAGREYQTSTLTNVNSEEVLQKLEELMSEMKVYEDNELSLSSLAKMLSLKPYQLSELLNTKLGLSFSSYLRNYRIRAAEELLKSDESVSVLAIGLNVGFSSQSAFYSAFKELHSMAPGQYRKQG